MAKTLNFNNLKKQYLTVTLSDEKNTTLMIGTPTKSVLDKLDELQTILTSVAEGEAESNVINDLYDTCAKVMSRNKGGITITGEYLADVLDYEDIIIFFNSYMEFINEVISSKN